MRNKTRMKGNQKTFILNQAITISSSLSSLLSKAQQILSLLKSFSTAWHSKVVNIGILKQTFVAPYTAEFCFASYLYGNALIIGSQGKIIANRIMIPIYSLNVWVIFKPFFCK